MLSSIDVSPLVTTPSTGIFSPGLTITKSPSTTSSTLILTSFLFLSTVAVFGEMLIRRSIASLVFPLAPASSIFPMITRVIRTAETSKYCAPSPKKSMYTL